MAGIQGIDVGAMTTRAKNIITEPATEWDKVAAESANIQDLIARYAAILALIPAIAGFAGAIMGFRVGPVAVHFTIGQSVGIFVMQYLMAIAGVVAASFVVDFLAPQFGGQSSRINSFKLCVYSMTPSWLSGIFMLFPPPLSMLGLLGLYSAYLFYLGAPKLMKVPQDKVIPFTIVVVLATAFVMALFMLVLHT